MLSVFAFIFMGASQLSRLLMVGALVLILSLAAVVGLTTDANDGGVLIDVIKMGREQETEDVASLTGRMPVWRSALQDIAERPLFGYGYGGFWTPEREVEYAFQHDWKFSHSHSVYLETLLSVGAVGLLWGLLIIVAACLSAVRGYRATGDIGYRFIAAILAMAIIHGFLDANFIRNGFETMLALICIAGVTLYSGQANGKLESTAAVAVPNRRRTRKP